MSEEAVSDAVQEVVAPEPQSLDDILSDVPPEEETGAGEAEPEAKVEGESKDEPEPEAKEEEEPKVEDSTPESDKPAKEPWQTIAVLDERKKRQASDERADKADSKYEELLKRTNAEAAEKLDIFEDPDKVLGNMEERFSQKLADVKTDVAEEIMRSVHPDYDELLQEFFTYAETNPAALVEARNAGNSAMYAYETAKQVRELAQLKDPAALKEKYKAEAKAEALAEIEQERKSGDAKLQQKRNSIQPSLTGAQSKGTHETVPEDTLDDILNG